MLGSVDGASGAGPGLHALIVPDMSVLRERRIVNIRELIRFELEGLSLSLPVDKRIVRFDVTLDPLPRDPTGALKRHDIVEQYRAHRAHGRPPAAESFPMDGHVVRINALVQAFVPHIPVRPESNLELDLGLDSIERVELLASLEQRFRTRLSDEVANTAFCVRDLANAFRGQVEDAQRSEPSWDALLEVSAPGPELGALLKRRTMTAAAVYGFVRVLVRAMTRPRISGLEHLPRTGPFIIAPNHQTYIDPLVVECALPFRVFRQLFFVGAAEYFQTPLTARLARALNIVPVDPDAYLLSALQAGAFGLKHGKVLMLFPEGERSIDGRVKTFRKGAAILSQRLRVPVIPVALDGLFQIWPRNRPLDWRRMLPWSGHRVTIRFGPPLAAPSSGWSYAEHSAALRAAVEALWLETATRSSAGQSA